MAPAAKDSKNETRVMKQGFLNKKSVGGWFKTWRNRFIVLKRSEISWQKDSQGKILGSLKIDATSKVERLVDMDLTLSLKADGKELMLTAETENAVAQWQIALQDQIDSHKSPESSFFHADNDRKFENDYNMKQDIGDGSYGSVKKATRIKDGKDFAVKVIKRAELFQDGVDIRVVEREVNILINLKHRYIAGLESFYVKGDEVFLIFELCSGGDLFERVSNRGRYSEANAKILIKRLVSALDFCHKSKILHRDLKMENVVLENAEDDTSAKLIDFGLARLTGADNTKMMTANVGTAGYLAPELINRRATGYHDKKCPEKVDVWGIGIIAFMACSASHPFYNKNPLIMDKRISKGDYETRVLGKGAKNANLSVEGRNFVAACFTVNAIERPSMMDLLKHPWLVDVNLEEPPVESSSTE